MLSLVLGSLLRSAAEGACTAYAAGSRRILDGACVKRVRGCASRKRAGSAAPRITAPPPADALGRSCHRATGKNDQKRPKIGQRAHSFRWLIVWVLRERLGGLDATNRWAGNCRAMRRHRPAICFSRQCFGLKPPFSLQAPRRPRAMSRGVRRASPNSCPGQPQAV